LTAFNEEGMRAAAREYHMDRERNECPWVPGPLDDLIERTAADKGAPFELSSVTALAKLRATNPADYETLRAELKAAGVRVSELDKLVQKKQAQDRDDAALSHWKVEPASEPVEGAAFLESIKRVFKRYIVLPKGTGTALALWTLHAWTMDAADISPFMVLVSPTKRCGKTSVLIVLYYLTPRSELASNISASALFRYVEEVRPTLLIDEADSFLKDNEEMRGILNSGHTKAAAYVIRNVEANGEHKPRRFSTWTPKAIATIRVLADTLEDRAIVVRLQRKAPGAKVERLRGRDSDELAALRSQAARWAADNLKRLVDAEPQMPEEMNDRAADNWRPLLAIADLVGGEWPKRAREAAGILSGESQDTAINVELLRDIRTAFGELEVMTSADLVAALTADPERPWATWGKNDKPLTQNGLARLLKPFGVISETVHPIGRPDAKGYKRVHFEEVWEGYLSGQNTSPRQISDFKASNRPNADGMGITRDFQSVQKDLPDALKNANLSHSHAGLDAWTDCKAGNGAKGEFDQERHSHNPAFVRHTETVIVPSTNRRCDYCGGMERVADPLRRWNWQERPDGILLHQRCESPWYDSAVLGAPCRAPALGASDNTVDDF